ncbi:MAG: OmpA family protein [Thermoanaerobaculia bacterium]
MNRKPFSLGPVCRVVAATLLLVQDAGAFSQSPSSVVWAPMSPVYFRSGSTHLDREARRMLSAYARLVKANPKTQLNIVGYTDTVGTTAANVQLSTRRALVVKAHLISLGVRPEQMSAIGRGETQSLTGLQASRRVEIDVLMTGTAIFNVSDYRVDCMSI